MSKKYIIGIDGGSQSTKVVMYDLEGNVVCEGKGLLQPMHTPDADTDNIFFIPGKLTHQIVTGKT